MPLPVSRHPMRRSRRHPPDSRHIVPPAAPEAACPGRTSPSTIPPPPRARFREGLPVPRGRRCWPSEARKAKRGQHRVSGGQDARSERAATGHGQPRPSRTDPHAPLDRHAMKTKKPAGARPSPSGSHDLLNLAVLPSRRLLAAPADLFWVATRSPPHSASMTSRPCPRGQRTRSVFSLMASADWCTSSGLAVSFRKEVIQPQVPLRLPCYDLVPIAEFILGAWLLAVTSATSDAPHFRGLTGGVYKAQEHIHRGMLTRDY